MNATEPIMIPRMTATIGGQAINIIPPTLAQPCYEYAIERPAAGPRIPCKLTYDLLGEIQGRSLLRLDSRGAAKIWTLTEVPAFRDLARRVVSMATADLGKTSILKGIVVDLEAGETSPGITVSVHRFGPVPVAVLPSTPIVVNYQGKRVQISPAVYLSFLAGANSETTWTKYDILRSCKFKLDWLLTAYLEEVAEEFFDIQHHASKTDVFRRLKHAEEILAQSIHSKLEIVLTHAFENKAPLLYAVARELWSKFDVMIMVAALARVFALFFINEMYRFLGIMDKSEKYQGRWQQTVEDLRSQYDTEGFDRLIDSGKNNEISTLNEAIRRYWDESYDSGFEDLVSSAQPRLWLERFVGFADFVSSLRKERSVPHVPRLFFSAQHRQEAATGFVNSARLYVSSKKDLFTEQPAHITMVQQERPGENIEKLVKARIWSSQGVIGVIPKRWMSGGTKKNGHLQWLAKETDHGLITKRHIHLFLEEEIDRDSVSVEFGGDFEPLSPARGRIDPQERRRNLQEQVQAIVNSSFRYVGTKEIEGSARDGLETAITRARDSMCKDLVHGFLEQLPATDRTTIARVLHVARHEMTKAQIARKMVEFLRFDRQSSSRNDSQATKREAIEEKKFERARASLRNRRFKIRGEVLELIVRNQKGHAYRGNLRRILTALRPELHEEQIEQLHQNILARYLGPIDVERVPLQVRKAAS